MVGVPRSKGCARCRQRRKGCDKQRPSCGQCKANGVTCPGYERELVFLNSFTEPDSATRPTTTRYSKAAVVATSNTRSFPADPADSWLQLLSPDNAAHIGTPVALLANADTTQLTGRFMQEYLPSGRPAGTLDSWIEVVPTMKSTDRLAHEALRSIALCTAGRTLGDPVLMRRGLDLYGFALHYTTSAVQDAKLSRTTSVLAAVKTFGMIELLYGTDKGDLIPTKSWVGHVDGQIAVTLLRPPEAYQLGIEHRLFVGSRYAQLVACITGQKRYILNTPEWRTVPWKIIPKSKKDHLVDILADLVDLAVDIGIMNSNTQNRNYGLSKETLMAKAWRHQDEMLQWLTDWGPLKVFHDADGVLVVVKDQADFALADLTLFYWTLRLLLCHLVRRMHPVGTEVPSDFLPSEYIHKLARAIPFFMTPGTGIMGNHRVAWPLGVFLTILRENNDATPEDLAALDWIIKFPEVQAALGKFMAGFQK